MLTALRGSSSGAGESRISTTSRCSWSWGVIAVHTAIIYGVDGSFYLEGYDSMSDVSVGVLTAFVAVGFLFGLGAFFLIAGRLSGPSLDRKGPRRFLVDRLVRLGIPIVFYVLVIAPV